MIKLLNYSEFQNNRKPYCPKVVIVAMEHERKSYQRIWYRISYKKCICQTEAGMLEYFND